MHGTNDRRPVGRAGGRAAPDQGPPARRGGARDFALRGLGALGGPLLGLFALLALACPATGPAPARPTQGEPRPAAAAPPSPAARRPATPAAQEPAPKDMADQTCPMGHGCSFPFEPLDRAAARARIWPTPGPRVYRPPTPTRRSAHAALVRALVHPERHRRAELDALAAAAGFQIEAWEVEGRRLLVALEAPEERGGGGAYLIRVGAAAGPPVLLQAPHAMSDLDTGPLALDLLVDGDAWPQAVFVATLGRRWGVDGRRGPADGPADPCHNDEHLLALATAIAVVELDGLEVVQLHGFGDDEAARDPALAAIVSAGERRPSARSRALRERLGAATGARVALFPEDVDRLGALTNLQGAAVRDLGRGAGFLHLELSPAIRRQLRQSTAGRARFAAALQAPATAEGGS